MCGPLTSFITGTAAKGAQAATSGLFGSAGAFGIGQTLATVGALASIGSEVKEGRVISEAKTVESGLLKREAALIERQGKFDVSQRKEEARKLASRQKVVTSKSGVTRTGSVLEVMNEAAEIAEKEVLNIEFGAESGSQAKLFEASAAEKSGRSAKKAGRTRGLTTALTSFGSRF